MKTIQIEKTTYLKFLSTEVMTMNISDRAFRVWCMLQFKYRQHINHADDCIKVYQCHNQWLAEKFNTSVASIERAIKELHEAHLLYSFQPKGEAAYRVPVDPADSNYKDLVQAINAFESEKTLRKLKWIEHNQAEETKKEETIVVPASVVDPQPTKYDPNIFINYIKRTYSFPIVADLEHKVFYVNTGRADLFKEWNSNLTKFKRGWTVERLVE